VRLFIIYDIAVIWKRPMAVLLQMIHHQH